MPLTSMILPRTLATGHAWLSKRVGRANDVFTEISRAINKWLWMVEAYLHQ